MGQDPSPAGNIRIGYRERDAVAAVLQEAAGDGRLSMAELDDRLDAALHAKTYADLDPLVVDLSVELPSHALNRYGRRIASTGAVARGRRVTASSVVEQENADQDHWPDPQRARRSAPTELWTGSTTDAKWMCVTSGVSITRTISHSVRDGNM